MSNLLDTVINAVKETISHSDIFDDLKNTLTEKGLEYAKQVAMEKGLSPEMVEQLEGLAKTTLTDATTTDESTQS